MKTQSSVDQSYQFIVILMAALAIWHNTHPRPIFLLLIVLLAVIALVSPRVLDPILRLWMKLGLGLSWVMSRVLLSVVFFAVVMPISFLRKRRLREEFGIGHKPSAAVKTSFKSRDHQFSKEDFTHPF